jgi:hypothetical protein
MIIMMIMMMVVVMEKPGEVFGVTVRCYKIMN